MKCIFRSMLIVMILTQCYHGRNHDVVPGRAIEPTFDRFIGLTITEIEGQFGKPNESVIRRSGTITSPLDYTIRLRMGNDVVLKVYYYTRADDILYFWFARDAARNWVVVGDVTKPRGIFF